MLEHIQCPGRRWPASLEPIGAGLFPPILGPALVPYMAEEGELSECIAGMVRVVE